MHYRVFDFNILAKVDHIIEYAFNESKNCIILQNGQVSSDLSLCFFKSYVEMTVCQQWMERNF